MSSTSVIYFSKFNMRFAAVLCLVMTTIVMPVSAATERPGDPDAIGHSADGNYLDLSPLGKVELPRIFVVRGADGIRFDVFPNTRAALDSGRYTLGDAAGNTMVEASLAEALSTGKHYYFPVEPRQGSILLDLSITRQLVFVFIAAALLLLLGLSLASRYKREGASAQAPRGSFQNLMEVVIIFIRDEIAKPTIGDRYRKYLPYLLTVFLFILIGNLLGLVPWGVTATSNIMVTATLAIITFVITQLSGTKDYWKHIFWPPGVPTFVKPILIPVEILGMFTKPFALAFRLFGNMVSGHLVILSILGLIFIFAAQFGTAVGSMMIFVSIPLTMFIFILKLAVSLIQAYVFTMLSALFIGLAIEEHHHDEHHEIPAKGYSGGSLDQAAEYVPTEDGRLKDVVMKPRTA